MAGADHRVLLLQAVYHGRLAHIEMHRGESARQFKLWVAMTLSHLPALLGDNDHTMPDGPSTWPIAARLMR